MAIISNMKKAWIVLALMLLLAACAPAVEPVACDDAQFVEHVIVDVPVQEGSTVMPGTHFTKTWQLRNDGSCDWTADYALVHTGGEAMSDQPEIALPLVAPGESVDLAVSMTAPSQPGSYISEWMLRNADGELFGVGPEGDRPLTAEFTVAELPAGVVYDFGQVTCMARWDSARAQFLSCDGSDDEQGMLDGFVRIGRNGTIEAKPNNQQGGWIAGYFPPIEIKEGDHFVATVGCVDEQNGCSIEFTLKGIFVDGPRAGPDEFFFDPYPLSADEVVEIDIDLSSLAGNVMSPILYVAENGGRSLEALGYWRGAHIENAAN